MLKSHQVESPQTGLVNRALLHVLEGGRQPMVRITVKEAGNVRIRLTDAAGQMLQEWPAEMLLNGAIERQLSVGSHVPATKGMYYLHLFFENEWQQMQELEW
jgi:hypothetical protein